MDKLENQRRPSVNVTVGSPRKAFIIGLVRVTLWQTTNKDAPNSVTIERNRPGIQNTPNYTTVLDETDIPKAILALKQAYDFLQKAHSLNWDHEDDTTHLQAPERIP